MKATIKRACFGLPVGAVVEVLRNIDANTLYVKSAHFEREIPKTSVRLMKDKK